MRRRGFLVAAGVALAGCLGSNSVDDRVYAEEIYSFELQRGDTLVIEITVEEGSEGIVQVNRRSIRGEVLLDERTRSRSRWELEVPYSDIYRVQVIARGQLRVDIHVES